MLLCFIGPLTTNNAWESSVLSANEESRSLSVPLVLIGPPQSEDVVNAVRSLEGAI